KAPAGRQAVIGDAVAGEVVAARRSVAAREVERLRRQRVAAFVHQHKRVFIVKQRHRRAAGRGGGGSGRVWLVHAGRVRLAQPVGDKQRRDNQRRRDHQRQPHWLAAAPTG